MKEIIKNTVYELRIAAAVTQESFAEAIGVTRQTVIAIEKGNYTPSVMLALKIARFFKKMLKTYFLSRMKNNSLLGESIISLLLVVLLVLCWNPGGRLWMPSMATSMVLLGLIIVFLVFAAFVWKERARDEREEKHRLISGRVSFLCGAAVLVTGIVAETYQGKTDFWLLAALAVMVLAKLGTRVRSEMFG